jgi:hydroxyacylglutathione hydrolase
MIHVETIVVGPLQVNCYVVSDTKTKKAFIVDPGAEAEKIKEYVVSNRLEPEFIINTHCHYDHIGANDVFDIPIFIHELDGPGLCDHTINLSIMLQARYVSPPAQKKLRDSETLSFCAEELLIIHTPGHSPGSICIKMGERLFAGDTVFRGSIGRTDLPGGDSRQIMKSIRTKILTFDSDLEILPGHGDPSSLEWERQHNFFLSNNTV